MTHEQEDQLVLDAAWDWLVRMYGPLERKPHIARARVDQLCSWNRGQR